MNHILAWFLAAMTLGFPMVILAQEAIILQRADKKGEDPAYIIYKAGYNAVLDERWSEALEKLSEVRSKYPKSPYIDDAEYWSAYVMRQTDLPKAVSAYKQFLKKNPGSRYYDDAVADLAECDVTFVTHGDGPKVLVSTAPRSYAYGMATDMKRARQHMRKVQRELRTIGHTMRGISPPPASGIIQTIEEEELDPLVKVKLDALYALSESRDDEKSFQTIKEVALDKTQPLPLRRVAVDLLADVKKFDALPVLVELATADTNEPLQSAAIECIGTAGADKNRTVDLLTVLFDETPKHDDKKLATILYTIADVGTDRAIDFLSKVARSHTQIDLRRDAVYYLGTIGSDKARGVLYQILKDRGE